MKEIYILYFKLDNLEEKIVSKKLLIELIRDVVQDEPEKYLKKLRENRKIKFIIQNYYYILSDNERRLNQLRYNPSELVFSVLNKSNVKWYISLEKGLELNNILWQAHKKINIINNKISGEKTIIRTKFDFKKTKPQHINNYKQDNYKQNKTKNRITQNIGLNEKIYLDFIYFKKRVPIELEKAIDKSKVISILSDYPKTFQKKVKEGLYKDE